MRKIVKWSVIAFLGVMVAAVGAGYVILAGYDFNSLKPQITDAARNATGRELVINGNIDLAISLHPALVVENIRFQNAAWGSRPDMAMLKKLEVKLALVPLLGGTVEIERLILLEPDILIETDESGASNTAFGTGKPETKKARETSEPAGGKMTVPAFGFRELLIQDGVITYKNRQTGESHQVFLTRMALNGAGIESPLALDMAGTYKDHAFTAGGDLGPLKAVVDEKEAWSFDLTASALAMDVGLKGTIRNPLAQEGLEIAFSIQGKDFGELERVAGTDIPFPPPLELSGKVSDPGPKTYRISDFTILLGETGLKGEIVLDLAGNRPGLTASLSSERVDLRPLMAHTKKSAAGSRPKGKAEPAEKVFPSTPLPLDGLSAVDADLLFKAGRLLTPHLAVSDLDMKMTLKDGNLAVKPLTAMVGGGTLEATADLVPRGKKTTLGATLKMDSLDIKRMLKELKADDIASGKLDLDLNLRGRGDSVASLMGSLDGTITVIMDEGLIRNKYLDLVGGDLMSNLIGMLNPAAEAKENTVVNCLVNRFDIRKGVAGTTVMVFDTDQMSVVGDGKIDLGNETIDLGIKPQPKKGLASFGLSLGELAKPFKLGGTLAKPALRIDTVQALTSVGKTVGGVVLFGGVGIAAGLIGQKGDENLCEKALEVAKTGKAPKSATTSTGESIKSTVIEKPAQVVEDTVKGIGGALKGLFRK